MHTLFAAIDAGACGSVLLFASPAIIGGAAIYFLRRVNKKPTAASPAAPSSPRANVEDKSLQDVGR